MAANFGNLSAEEIKNRLREQSVSQLTEDMNKLSSTSDYDVDLLCAYLDVLEEKDPILPKDFEPDKALEKFEREHADLFEELENATDPVVQPEPAKKPRLRRSHMSYWRIALKAALVLTICGVVAQATVPGVFDGIIEWGTEAFSIKKAGGQLELPEAVEGEFVSLQAALDEHEVAEKLAPTWIPSGFSLESVDVVSFSDYLLFNARYTSEEKSIFIRISDAASDRYGIEYSFEDGGSEYSTNGVSYFISENVEQARATWIVGHYLCTLSGDLSLQELQEVLDSIK